MAQTPRGMKKSSIGTRRAEMTMDVGVDLPEFFLFSDPNGPLSVQLHLAIALVFAF